MKFGIRLHVIVRETEDEAWRAAESLISRVDDETVIRAQAAFARGFRRPAPDGALHAGGARRTRADLEISPNLWAGVGLVRRRGHALVGDPKTVAARIEEYARSASTTSSSRAIRIWRRRIASPSWCSPLAAQTASGAAGRDADGPFGEVVANLMPRAFSQS